MDKEKAGISNADRNLRKKAAVSPRSDKFTAASIILQTISSTEQKTVTPDKALDIIQSVGIPTPAYLPAKTVKEASDAAELLGFPVVLKISSPEIVHKSDIGGVAVNMKCREDVEKHYHTIMRTISRHQHYEVSPGILVEKQQPVTTEVIVGGIRDEQFGPAVMFGLGGIFVEIFADVSFMLAPVTEEEALKMIQSIRGYRLLTGYRGGKAMDIPELVKSIVIISELISYIDMIKEVEINPLFIYEEGAVAVDARIILGQKFD